MSYHDENNNLSLATRLYLRLRSLSLFHQTDKELRSYQRISFLIIIFAYLLPAEGLGFSVCLFYNLTGLPCPGCGLTRSVVSAGHLSWEHSLQHHPFGFLVFLASLFFVLSAFWPYLARIYIEKRKTFRKYFVIFGLIVLSFGIVRSIWVLGDFRGSRILFAPHAKGNKSKDRPRPLIKSMLLHAVKNLGF